MLEVWSIRGIYLEESLALELGLYRLYVIGKKNEGGEV